MKPKPSNKGKSGVKGRPCLYPDCKSTGMAQGRQHADGSTYYRPWCKSHLKGPKKQERIVYLDSHPHPITKKVNKKK